MTTAAVRFHSRANRVLAGVVWAVGVLMVVATLTTGDGSRVLQATAVATVLVVVTWATLWSPSVEVDDRAVTFCNVSHVVTVPWEAVIAVETRYALSVRTPTRSYSAWAAPAPGRFTGRRAARARRRPGEDELVASQRTGDLVSDLPGTDSGDAAGLVRRRWEGLLAADRVRIGGAAAARVRVVPRVTVLLALTVAIGVAALLLVRA